MRRRDVLVGIGAMFVARRALAGALEEGDAALAAGDQNAAIAAWNGAVDGASGPARAELLLRLAAVERSRGALDVATGKLDAVTALKLFPARVAYERGLVHLSGGDVSAAVKRLTEALEAARDLRDKALSARVNHGLGQARLALGRPDEAARAFEAAHTGNADAGAAAEAGVWAGVALDRAGRGDEARALLTEIAGATSSGADLTRALAGLALGDTLLRMGSDVEAETAFAQAKAHASAVEGHDSRFVLAAAHGRLARVALRGGDVAAAEAAWGEAEAACAGVAPGAGSNMSSLLFALGAVEFGGDTSVSYRLCRLLSLTTHEAAPPPPPSTARGKRPVPPPPSLTDDLRALHSDATDPRLRAFSALALAARVYREAPDDASAFTAEARSVDADAVAWRADLVDARVALLAGRRDEALAVALRGAEAFERVRWAARAPAPATDTPAALHATLVAATLGGELEDAAVAAERLALAELDEPLAPDDLTTQGQRALAERQRWLEAALGASRASDAEPSVRTQALSAALTAVRAEHGARLTELRSKPRYTELVRVERPALDQVRGALPEGLVVLQPVALADTLLIFVHRRERLTLCQVTLGAADLLALVRDTERALRNDADPDAARVACDALGAVLYTPVSEELATATRVVWAPTGALRAFPFGALRHDGKWLVERVPVGTVTHVSALRTPVPELPIGGGATLIAGETDADIAALARRFVGAEVLVSPGRDALLAGAQGRALLHVALPVSVDAEVEHTTIATADTALGVRALPAFGSWFDRARLVVLPRAQVAATADTLGLHALAGQLGRVGVRAVLGSLWPSPDPVAFTSAVYAELGAQKPLTDALRVAQLAAMESHPHPKAWAGWAVVEG